ncbi:hypothetical protein SAMN05661044_04595 [Olivibacter domesticus]|uniref:Uncharacterized protein n=1 Tax=Olivibacter domesticus TaxID=407022 RepID=A0A1H7WQG5_OLID1|nr:hypothetical protein SAMN05661044_04595 [Olivibacter domesticus]
MPRIISLAFCFRNEMVWKNTNSTSTINNDEFRNLLFQNGTLSWGDTIQPHARSLNNVRQCFRNSE